MEYQLRPIASDELPAFVAVDHAAFNGSPPGEEEIAAIRTVFNFERSLAAVDGSRLIATSGNIPFQLTLPGQVMVPSAGVTWVAVLPTYRRRGILRTMIGKLLDDAVAHGEPVAILHASESVIYGRFGFGLATSSMALEIDTRHAHFAMTPPDHGRVIALDPARAAEVLPPLYDQARRHIVGAISRSETWWHNWSHEPERHRGEWSSRFVLAYEHDGRALEGFLTYHTKRPWEHGTPAHVIRINDLIALTPRAHAALWRACLSMDLVTTVQTSNSPVDEPVRWMLADPRRLRVTDLWDALWLRIVDVPGALSARHYAREDALVIAVDDPFRPDQTGRYVLEGGPAGARCRRTTQQADLYLSAADLGAVYLGGVRWSTLALAGRIEERTSGALQRADAMFAAERAPWSTTEF
jgi:predicted acetyltransferase